VFAVGTPVGTTIQNTATVDLDLAGTPIRLTSNTTTVTVVERIDVLTTLQSGQIQVAANDVDQALLFIVTNIGNGAGSLSALLNQGQSKDLEIYNRSPLTRCTRWFRLRISPSHAGIRVLI
jgi:hypothetical protein